MPVITIIFGIILCGLSGFVLWLQGKFALGTWLIPAGFGLVLILLGILSQLKPGARKHAMHGAALVGTIGAILCLSRGISQLPKLVRGDEVNTLAFGMIWSMAVVCLTFVGVCVQSFVAARKARETAARKDSTQTSSPS